jgi:SAM-dependent methyltransferase
VGVPYGAGVGGVLRRALVHPLAADLDPDDPRAPEVHRRIIGEKPLLRAVYDEWYAALADAVGSRSPVLEIGSGGGYLRDRMPGLVTSDIRRTPAARVVCDAHAIPVRDGGLGAIVMTNALHHLPDVSRFLHEAARAVRPGGCVAAIEPWVSPWSRVIYSRLHREPFDPRAEWTFAAGGPLSSANGALPWILVDRDRSRFQREHPEWEIRHVRPGWPLCYLLSGGVSLRSLVPTFVQGACRALERRLDRSARWAMFALIVLERRSDVRSL